MRPSLKGVLRILCLHAPREDGKPGNDDIQLVQNVEPGPTPAPTAEASETELVKVRARCAELEQECQMAKAKADALAEAKGKLGDELREVKGKFEDELREVKELLEEPRRGADHEDASIQRAEKGMQTEVSQLVGWVPMADISCDNSLYEARRVTNGGCMRSRIIRTVVRKG